MSATTRRGLFALLAGAAAAPLLPAPAPGHRDWTQPIARVWRGDAGSGYWVGHAYSVDGLWTVTFHPGDTIVFNDVRRAA